MQERFRTVRKQLGLSQTAFAEKLGITRDVINNIENSRVEPSELVIRVVCSTFGVDYDWLKNGQGNMYPTDEDAVLAALDDLMTGENEETKALIRALARMDEKELAVINKLIRTLKEELR
jgi:transcriptional regulator with XRE-family HTH domain